MDFSKLASHFANEVTTDSGQLRGGIGYLTSKVASLLMEVTSGTLLPTVGLVIQPTITSCTQACLAMATGSTAERVTELYGDGGMSTRELLDALEVSGVCHNMFTFNEFVATGWYIVTVPSLNHFGTGHRIVVEYNAYEGVKRVLDPSPLRKYKDDGTNMTSYSELIYFVPGRTLKGPRR